MSYCNDMYMHVTGLTIDNILLKWVCEGIQSDHY